jgi:thiol-disulfide isomerase/thioredoxin
MRWSKLIEALMASMIASGPAANRPPHIWFEDVFAVSFLVMMKPFGGKKMRNIWLAPLYAGLALSANAAFADLSALTDGNFAKLQLHDAPAPVSEAAFFSPGGQEHTLSDYRGKIVVVNFWATWCAPCRKEMPSLDRLQAELGGDDFAVVTLATGRNKLPAIEAFLSEGGLTNLPILLDPKSAVARDMDVLGLPATVILNRNGQEIARLVGEAEWDNPQALEAFIALIKGE